MFERWLKESVDFVVAYPEFVIAEVAALLLAMGIMLYFFAKKPKKVIKVVTQGELDEMKRRVQLESVYADKIHDFMLDMLVKGEITRKEYKRDCKRFGVSFRLNDLLRNPRSKIGIKHRIIRNVRNNHSTLPFIQAERIPGPKPGEGMPVVAKVAKRKVWLAVGSRR